MIKANCVGKCGFQACGSVQFFWAVTVPMLINPKDVVTFIFGIYRPFFEMRLF